MEEIIKEKYIYVYDKKKKVKNPLYNLEKADIKSYYGNVDEINFEHQTNNYNNLKDTFKPFGITFEIIFYGKFTNSVNKPITTFLVKTNDENISWYKYEALAPGGSHNKLFINGNTVKVTDWLNYSQTEREVLLQF